MRDFPSIADEAARTRALDISTSFIVQAPAGSGKTELLTQRFLALLGQVSEPEEILAITFTRKAVGEMRERVLGSLRMALDAEPPAAPHLRTTWELARAALANARRQEWNLLEHPTRLRIQTIDALCASIVRQIPYFSRLGGQMAISDEPARLYRQAAMQTLEELECPHVRTVLTHLHNDMERACALLMEMLQRREQWLHHIVAARKADRAALERSLAHVRSSYLLELQAGLDEATVASLAELAAYAASNLDENHPLARIDWSQGLGFEAAYTGAWIALSSLLLTQKGTWRRSFTKNDGFPPPKNALIPAIKALLQELAASPQAENLCWALQALALIPATYDDDQWPVLHAINELLLKAVGHLWLVFGRSGCVDFSQMSLAAVEGLGSDDEPTDLALKLDYRLNHILVDEFQDTSASQYRLLRKLTAGWQPGDGRTLFVVGDPMQSIYRFRQAEVGLFLQARQQGIGNVQLEPLSLSVNFRSTAAIVHWNNQIFSRVFPAVEEISSGAIAYSASSAFHGEAEGPDCAVQAHLLPTAKAQEEARAILACIEDIRSRHPGETIAILARNRTHLDEIISLLKGGATSFSAIDIAPLAHSGAVRDLQIITRALCHPGDSIAWLALLRAPWCGLTLADLQLLTAGADGRTLWQCLQEATCVEPLSADGQARLLRIRPALIQAMEERGRQGLARWVEGTWRQLGGPAFLERPAQLEDARVFLHILQSLEEEPFPEIQHMEEALASVYCSEDPSADSSLQLMTIHKAKGLEFDHVIIPGLCGGSRSESKPLLAWHEGPHRSADMELLLAIARRGRDQKESSLYEYIRQMHQRCMENEQKRLLYVACTRSRKGLHLFARLRPDRSGEDWASPRSGSLLRHIWEQLQPLAPPLPDAPEAEEQQQAQPPVPLKRVHSDWRIPRVAPRILPNLAITPAQHDEGEPQPEFQWAGEMARLVGVLFHQWVRRLGEKNERESLSGDMEELRKNLRWSTYQLGVPHELRASVVERTITALGNMGVDQRGRWILSSSHQDSRWEYPLTGTDQRGHIVNIIIDRMFIDDQGTRWIIDYKTGQHEGGGLEHFLREEQQRYAPQLERYGFLAGKLGPQPVRLGLYFPFHQRFVEWGVGEGYGSS